MAAGHRRSRHGRAPVRGGDVTHAHAAVESPAPRVRIRALTCGDLVGDTWIEPVTRQSDKVKAVVFRWGEDKQLRDALCDFAADTRHVNPWAARLYDQAHSRGHDHPHAVRILARAWAAVIWRGWQDNALYVPQSAGPSKPSSNMIHKRYPTRGAVRTWRCRSSAEAGGGVRRSSAYRQRTGELGDSAWGDS